MKKYRAHMERKISADQEGSHETVIYIQAPSLVAALKVAVAATNVLGYDEDDLRHISEEN